MVRSDNRMVVVLASDDDYKAVAARSTDGSLLFLMAFRDEPMGDWDRHYLRLPPAEADRLGALFTKGEAHGHTEDAQ